MENSNIYPTNKFPRKHPTKFKSIFKRKEWKTFEATHVIKHKESFPFLQEIFLPYQNSTNICLIKNNFIPQKYHLLLNEQCSSTINFANNVIIFLLFYFWVERKNFIR